MRTLSYIFFLGDGRFRRIYRGDTFSMDMDYREVPDLLTGTMRYRTGPLSLTVNGCPVFCNATLERFALEQYPSAHAYRVLYGIDASSVDTPIIGFDR